MKPVVRRSLNDATGQRCVDLVQTGEVAFHWLECRRDPEDAHGWRVITGSAPGAFASIEAAQTAARGAVCWLQEGAE